MGCEYSLNFSENDAGEIAALLKTLPYFKHIETVENRDQYIFRTPGNSGPLPSGLAEISPSSGIYFCDYGEGQEILKELIFRVAMSYDNLAVIDHSE